ncbi:MAG: NfeD family protein [Actinomycetota bacterium]
MSHFSSRSRAYPALPVSCTGRRRAVLWVVLILAAATLAATSAQAQGAPRPNTADYIEVSGPIDPSVAKFLSRQIPASSRDGTGVVILRIDTPGALDASVLPALEAIRESEVPVIVWAAPGDAQAASAGAVLLLAGHHSVMSPGATVGPLEPLDLKRFGRPAQPEAPNQLQGFDAEELEALRSGPLSAERALETGLIDSVAPNVQELLQSLQGLQIDTPSGPVTLSQDPLVLRFMKMGLLERMAHAAAQPGYAYLLLVLGLFGLLFELYNPGVGGAAVFGGIFVAFSFYALTLLPTSWLAVAGILLAFALMTWDLRTMSLGPASWAGLAGLVAASFWMYPGAHPALAMPLWAPLTGVALTVMFFVQAMTSAIQARTAKPIAGSDGIVDAVGVARTDVAPDGQVMARGTLWRARTLGMAIAEGTPVKVMGVSGLTLMVEPTDEAPDAQDQVDIGDAEAPEVQGSEGPAKD